MNRRILFVVAGLLVLLAGALWFARRGGGEERWTGFVEGEERLIRAEVPGRVRAIEHAEGEMLAPGAVVARLDTADVEIRIEAQRAQIAIADADIRAQEERLGLTAETWRAGIESRRASLRRAEATAAHAERNYKRELDLERSGASTSQSLDDARTARDQAASGLDQARDQVQTAAAEERNIPLARNQLEAQRRRRELAVAQLRELEVARDRAAIRAPAVATLLQTRFLREGELAQPGSAMVAVIDPRENHVRVYLPAEEMTRVRVGTRVVFQPDSATEMEIPGEIAFIADRASFTPEKIETRGDRLGQVYLAKIRILEAPERLLPGAEGDIRIDEAAGALSPVQPKGDPGGPRS